MNDQTISSFDKLADRIKRRKGTLSKQQVIATTSVLSRLSSRLDRSEMIQMAGKWQPFKTRRGTIGAKFGDKKLYGKEAEAALRGKAPKSKSPDGPKRRSSQYEGKNKRSKKVEPTKKGSGKGGDDRPFVEPTAQKAKQAKLKVNDLPRLDMPQLYDASKDKFFEKLKENGTRFVDKKIPGEKLTGLQAEYKAEKVHGISGVLKDGKVIGGTAIISSDGYIIDGHHRWRAHYQAGKDVPCTVIDMKAAQIVDMMHRFDGSLRMTVDEQLVSNQTGFGPNMAKFLHSSLDPVMQKAFTVGDYRRPIDKKQPMSSENEVITKARQNLADYNKILDMGKGVSKSINGTAVDGSKDGAFGALMQAVESGTLKGPFILIAGLKTDSEKGLARAREKVADNYDGDWGRLKDVVRGTIGVNSYDDIPAAVEALRENAKKNDWVISMRPEDRFSNPTSAGYRDIQLFIESPDGLVAEVQVNTKAMWVAKEKYGHKLYEESRSLSSDIKNNGPNPDKIKRIEQLDEQMKKLYSDAWKASGGNSVVSDR